VTRNRNFPGICLFPSLTIRNLQSLCLNHSLHLHLWTISAKKLMTMLLRRSTEFSVWCSGPQNVSCCFTCQWICFTPSMANVLGIQGGYPQPAGIFGNVTQPLYLHHDKYSFCTRCNDKLAKVRPVIDYMNSACLVNFSPGQTLSVDKSMIPYFRCHGAKQYIHGKTIKFGNVGFSYSSWLCCQVLSIPRSMNNRQRAWSWWPGCVRIDPGLAKTRWVLLPYHLWQPVH